MAEFTEVCKQAFRKAEAESGMKPHYAFLFVSATGTNVVAHTGELAVPPEKLEADIMQWAAEHPEPKYPSWNKGWEKLFPNAVSKAPPCPKYFLDDARWDCLCDGRTCDECVETPIPADIAEKLGIKLIGGAENEKD